MIKADEFNQWIKCAKSYCSGKRCHKCDLGTDGPHGVVCSWVVGSMTQEQVDLIAAYEPPVVWSEVPQDAKVIVWDADETRKYKRHFAKYANGKIYTFDAGATSWSGEPGCVTEWECGELAEDDE